MKRLTPITEEIFSSFDRRGDLVFPLLLDLNEQDLIWHALNHTVLYIRKAQESAIKAESWRNFKVGSLVVATNQQHSAIGLFGGYNIKPDESDEGINIHAEQMAKEKSRRAGLDKILSVAVYGPLQNDTQSGRVLKTLHPCGLCRDLLINSPEVSGSTVILSGNEGFTTCEFYNLTDLISYHEGPEDGVFNAAVIDLSDRAIDETNDFDFELFKAFLNIYPRFSGVEMNTYMNHKILEKP